ncbi:hypothetical protein [Catenulispora rubra]|uniref:hypothetical protein n=1 Tax=Catenulispora rubra TaxID=280293 RepID=UPI00189223F5|nr:hypothetical protein [Catenulispora rubra]
MTYRAVLADIANHALATLGADDHRAVYTSLRELVTNPQPQHGDHPVWKIGTAI